MGYSAPDSSLAWLTPIFVIERFTPNTSFFLNLNAKENLTRDEDALSMLSLLPSNPPNVLVLAIFFNSTPFHILVH